MKLSKIQTIGKFEHIQLALLRDIKTAVHNGKTVYFYIQYGKRVFIDIETFNNLWVKF